MLELFFVFRFCGSLAAAAEAKGRGKIWGGLGALFWFGGEFMGGALAFLLGLDFWPGYALALALAGCGAVVAWMIVKALPPALM